MRNSSDIFCLKEPKFGENDGSRIFSVNGSCYSRIHRRQTTTSNVFQYGCPQGTEQNPEIQQTTGSENPELPQEAETLNEFPETEDCDIPQVEIPGGGDHITSTAPGTPKSEEIELKTQPTVSLSSMRRNPLTGDGVEDVERRSARKRCTRNSGKWVW